MAEYCADADLRAECPDLYTGGIDDFDTQIIEAGKMLDRELESSWYRKEAEDRELDWRADRFDRADLLNVATQLKRAAVYLSIHLGAKRLTTWTPDGDKWGKMLEYYHDRYRAELEAALAFGIDYDWDDSAAIDDEERWGRFPRELARC